MTVAAAPGTGVIHLAGASIGYQTFAASGVVDGEVVTYGVNDGAEWEVGRGIYSSVGPTLSRGAIYSSNSNGPINASAQATVYLTPLSENIFQEFDLIGNTAGNAGIAVSNSTIALSGGVGVTLSGVGNTIVFSAASDAISTLSLYAVGNTTGQSSSTTIGGSLFFDAGGIGSIGFSAGSIIISATTAQSVQTLGLYAVGNTTGATSSTTEDARTISIEGAGIASVGFSNGSLIISASSGATAASGTVNDLFALGNTTGATSSTTVTLTQLSFSGAGGLSVGYSTTAAGAGVIVLSGATTAAQTAPTLSLFAVGNTTTSTSSGVIGAGSLSFDGAGIVSIGISGSSVVVSATSAASQGALSIVAAGNTTALTSSSVSSLPEGLTISGAGGVSVGLSSSTIVISGATTAAQTAAGLNIYAVGNTTTSTSSGAIQAGSLSFDGAGIVSVGVSGSSVVISASSNQSVQTLGLFAVGNTTTSVSSMTADARSLSFDGAGIVSIGMSGGSIVVSASTAATNPALSLYAVGNTTSSVSSGVNAPGSLSFDGAGIVSVGISGSSVVISATAPAAGNTMRFLEPFQQNYTSVAQANGTTMYCFPINPPTTLTMNQIRFWANRNTIGHATLSVTTATGATSTTATASAAWAGSHSVALYSSNDATTFTSVTSVSAVAGITSSWSVSKTSGSNSVTLSVSVGYVNGTVGSTDSYTISSSAAVSSAYVLAFAQSTAYTGNMYIGVPWATSLVGMNIMGYVTLAGTSSATGYSGLAIATGFWNLSAFMFSVSTARVQPGTSAIIPVLYGHGTTSAAGGSIPSSVVVTALGTSSTHALPYVQLGVF